MKRSLISMTVALGLATGTLCSTAHAFVKPGQTEKQPVGTVQQPAFDMVKLTKENLVKANQLLIKFSDTQPSSISSVLDAFDIVSIKSFYKPMFKLGGTNPLAKWRTVTFEPGENIQRAIEDLLADPSIEYVAPNWIYTAQATPNDLHSNLWGLNNTGQEVEVVIDYEGTIELQTGTADADIDAVEAWDDTTDASNVLVAVIDTGIDYNHPDLAANIWTNPGEIAGNGLDDDGNGLIDDVHGYDFVNNDGDPMDDNGHGTHCSGTIGAVANNGIGITGVAWNTKMMAVKILDAEGSGYASDIMNGVIYAADMGAKVSNNSWGLLFSSSVVAEIANRPIHDALQYTNEQGMLFVAAAGNNGTNVDASDGYSQSIPFNGPSAVELPNVIGVAATDFNDELAWFSNYGAVEVDLAAPGVAIYSTLPNNSYGIYNGTSMATPHVVGAAALLFAKKPELTAAEARNILMSTVDPVDALDGLMVSGGRLNVNNALTALDDATCPVFTATNDQHVSAGRATKTCSFQFWGTCYGASYKAAGSGDNMGSSGTTQTTLTEQSAGYFTTSGTCEGQFNYPPVLAMNGDAEIYLLAGTSYSDDGATATDREDGNITSSIQVSSDVNTNEPGIYYVTYNVTDSNGAAAITLTRQVYVVATDIPPAISLIGPHFTGMMVIPYMHEVDTPYVDPGYIAWDLIDGDLTDQVQVTSPLLTDTSQLGFEIVDYDVVDSNGSHWPNAGYINRFVVVVPSEDPLIMLGHSGMEGFPAPYTVEPTLEHTTWKRPVCEEENQDWCEEYWPYFAVFDLQEQQLLEENGQVTVNNPVDIYTTGQYQVEINATDSDGNTDSGTIIVNVVEDVTPPVITRRGEPEYTILSDLTGEAWWYAPGIDCEDDLFDSCNWSSSWSPSLDLTVPGTYVLTYVAWDGAGNYSDPLTYTLNVTRGSAPTVDSANFEVGADYLRVTGTASDVDGDLTDIHLIYGLGGQQCSGSTSFECNMTDLAPGTYTVALRADDARDNFGGPFFEYTFTIEEQTSCFTDTNANHEAAGRATEKYGILFYANGSNTYLGMSTNTTSLEETSSGYWTKVTSCP